MPRRRLTSYHYPDPSDPPPFPESVPGVGPGPGSGTDGRRLHPDYRHHRKCLRASTAMTEIFCDLIFWVRVQSAYEWESEMLLFDWPSGCYPLSFLSASGSAHYRRARRSLSCSELAPHRANRDGSRARQSRDSNLDLTLKESWQASQ